MIKIIVDSTRKMGELIEDLLEFSRLGRQNIVKTQIDMNKLFTSVYEEQKSLASEQKIDFVCHSLLPIAADESLLKHVISNLLANAIKFTNLRDPAKIEVGCYKEEQQVVYFVKDNGIGFDDQYSQKLFIVFQRLQNSENYEGTGVGLAIVDKVIHKHDGKVWAEAEEDKGATFYFSLPE